jgi:hypothetical protein
MPKCWEIHLIQQKLNVESQSRVNRGSVQSIVSPSSQSRCYRESIDSPRQSIGAGDKAEHRGSTYETEYGKCPGGMKIAQSPRTRAEMSNRH